MTNSFLSIRPALGGVLLLGLALGGCSSLGGGRATGPSTAPPAAKSTARSAKGFSIDTPIATIAADPAGKAVLQRDLPGLLERPEYGLFKTMSLKSLAPLSNGKITAATLTQVQRDLQNIPPGTSVQR
ncbi:MAG: hypothetical protein WA840_20045 [Caulobacteraceae bacterium]